MPMAVATILQHEATSMWTKHQYVEGGQCGRINKRWGPYDMGEALKPTLDCLPPDLWLEEHQYDTDPTGHGSEPHPC